jgi:biotin-(acetyl-CoA carboxylase) ligase
MKVNKQQRQTVKHEEQQKFQQQFSPAIKTVELFKTELKICKARYKQHHNAAQPAELAEWQKGLADFEQQGKLLSQNVNLLLSMNESL